MVVLLKVGIDFGSGGPLAQERSLLVASERGYVDVVDRLLGVRNSLDSYCAKEWAGYE